MTEQLQHAFEIARQLPAAAQNTLATYILSEIEKQGWDRTVSKREPQVQSQKQVLKALEESKTDEPEAPEFDCL